MISERNEAFGVRVYRGQERGYEWIGTFKFRDYGGRRGARKAAEQAEAEARFRGNARQRRTLTTEAYVARYLDDYRERQKDSAYVTASSRLAPFRREFGHLPLEDGSVDRRAASDWAHAHRSCVPAVVALFNQAIRDEELTRNPFKGLSRKTRGRRDKIPLSDAEIDFLCEFALRIHSAYGPMMRALILFAAYSGMRPGELFALRWEDVDFAAMRIHVRRRYYKGRLGPPKNGQERTIVLTPQAHAVLDTLPRQSELIFTAKRGGPLTQPLLSGYWTPLAALLGKRADKHGRYELVDFYELRHRAAWWLHVELGMPERLVAVQLGHTDGGKLVRELYGHGDHGALAEIDRYLDMPTNVVPLRLTG
jgi:integrase